MSATVGHLADGSGRGPLWGLASEDLNATLLAWAAGEGPAEHVNDERDVLFVVIRGGGTVTVDGGEHAVGAHDAVLVPKGARRSLTAGSDGIRYLTVHRKRTLDIHGP